MARSAAVLAVHLMNAGGIVTRAGSLLRDGAGQTTFIVDDLYLRAPDRPTLSLRWVDVRSEAATRQRLTNRADKIAYPGFLPPWFAGLLPEGALRDLVEAEMGPGDHDWFDVLARLGADLPGGVLVLPETEMGNDLGAVRWDKLAGVATRVPVPEGTVKFSLAGVQLKFNVVQSGDRLTMPGRAGEGRVILKAPTRHFPGLPEMEFTAMTLSRAAGVDTAPVRLVSVQDIVDVPEAFLRAGDYALAVDRFDRTDHGRIHIEDAAQILGAVGDRKYTMGNTETVLNMISRFSDDWRNDVLEGVRRIVADVLIGNGDNHLKNWSFRFADGVTPRLSPAYDIVPTALYIPDETLALEFVGARQFESISLAKFRRAAAFLKMDPDKVETEVRQFVLGALDLWPDLVRDMPISTTRQKRLISRMLALPLVSEVRKAS